MYLVEMRGIPSYVSTHFVRHKIGVEHYVQSNREDRSGAKPDDVTRMTPVNHGMMVNAQALINMARLRLCLAADRRTVAVMIRIRAALRDEAVYPYLVPDCLYRGRCVQGGCRAGVDGMRRAYESGD